MKENYINVDIDSVFNTPHGKRVIEYFISLGEDAGFHVDPYQHAYNAGKRSLAKQIRTTVDNVLQQGYNVNIDTEE